MALPENFPRYLPRFGIEAELLAIPNDKNTDG
jgi:hypothetical protein